MGDDNTFDKGVFEQPEMCYDFVKSCHTHHLNSFIDYFCILEGVYIIPSQYSHKIYVMSSIKAEVNVKIVVPDWMMWLFYTLPEKKYTGFIPRPSIDIITPSGKDKWYYAKVFAHKCIDMQVIESKNMLASKFYRLLHNGNGPYMWDWFPNGMMHLTGDEGMPSLSSLIKEEREHVSRMKKALDEEEKQGPFIIE